MKHCISTAIVTEALSFLAFMPNVKFIFLIKSAPDFDLILRASSFSGLPVDFFQLKLPFSGLKYDFRSCFNSAFFHPVT